jgi:hypothetical protein
MLQTVPLYVDAQIFLYVLSQCSKEVAECLKETSSRTACRLVALYR